ncbi:MAG: hypothetical protein ACMUJM_07810 [bacterium]
MIMSISMQHYKRMPLIEWRWACGGELRDAGNRTPVIPASSCAIGIRNH